MNSSAHLSSRVILLLKLICFALFLGRAWQHLFFSTPMDTTLPESAKWLVPAMGVLYAVLAIVSLLITSRQRWLGYGLLLGSVLLLILSLFSFRNANYQLAQLLEHAGQIGSPVLLYLALFGKMDVARFLFWVKVAVAVTFTCHGLFAAGVFYQQPPHFIAMTMSILGVSEPVARTFLQFAGLMDFVVSIGIFLPTTARYCLLYAVAWGFLTALARFAANVQWDALGLSLHQWLYPVVYRLPHAGLPLVALFLGAYRPFPVRHRAKTPA
ncbi:MAG: hypothetical protein ACFB15_08560 [Cyclobacteriaceae bacterium]